MTHPNLQLDREPSIRLEIASLSKSYLSESYAVDPQTYTKLGLAPSIAVPIQTEQTHTADSPQYTH